MQQEIQQGHELAHAQRLRAKLASRGNDSSFQQSIDMALAANASITTTEPIEQHIKDMTTLEIKILQNNLTALTQTEISDIENLANACPAVEGVGVYKARILNKYFHPLANYDDYENCNQQNKNGSGLFDDMIAVMQNGVTGMAANYVMDKKAGVYEVKVYPIPADNVLICTSNSQKEKGVLEILDISGRVLHQQTIQSSGLRNEVKIDHLSNGVYFYKVEFSPNYYTGKIEIIR